VLNNHISKLTQLFMKIGWELYECEENTSKERRLSRRARAIISKAKVRGECSEH